MPKDVRKIREYTDTEKLIIYALGALDYRPLRSKTKLEKLVFLVSNVFGDYKDKLRFRRDQYGPRSRALEQALEVLKDEGLVSETPYFTPYPDKGKEYRLTEEGRKIYEQLEPDDQLKTVLDEFKELLSGLRHDEMLTLIYVSYPEFRGTRWPELEKERASVALSLYKGKKVSFSKAVQISGLPAREFANLLKTCVA